MNPSDMAEILQNLQWWGASLLVLWLISWRLFAWMDKRADHKHELARESAKKERARNYSDALNNLADAHRETSAHTLAWMERLEGVLSGTIAELRTLSGNVGDLVSKSEGTMSVEDSIRIYESFFHHIRRESAHIIEDSLRGDDYEARPIFVKNKVRTAIARVITACRDQARKIQNLAVPVDQFFQAYVTNSGEYDAATGKPAGGPERFALCDMIWKAVAPSFEDQKRTGATQVAREARLYVENAVNDHFSWIAHIARGETSPHLVALPPGDAP